MKKGKVKKRVKDEKVNGQGEKKGKRGAPAPHRAILSMPNTHTDE